MERSKTSTYYSICFGLDRPNLFHGPDSLLGKTTKSSHELGVAKGSMRPTGGERGAGPETDVTTISRITRHHKTARIWTGLSARLPTPAASCSSDSRAGDPAQSGEANPSDSPTGINLRRVGRGRIGTHPFVSPKPPCRPAHGLGLAAATALLRFPFCLRQRHPS